ncbi:protein scalloped isoform X2 [Stomoxys calcitrans]|uniref:TEA domain-containing protein n=1 Tax=Stomoxys calcitrans TaxID=35570 RepID=A0A1I8PFL8_STOCA|nr:protein scalloped isoform X2 [Stomoxys calcitrans]
MKNITSSGTCGSGLLQLQNNLVVSHQLENGDDTKQKDGIVGAGTIASPWTPVSAGPPGALGPADSNGSMVDSKNLDVGDMSDDEKDLSNADAEGVWSPDIEQSFQEALSIYPPCGRRKIILSDEGKMYGRNELIARYIKLRTGKTRTRKQVSSHIQVLARRKLREIQAKIKVEPNGVLGGPGSANNAAVLHLLSEKEKALQAMSGMTSSQIVSAQAVKNLTFASALTVGLHHHAVHPHHTHPHLNPHAHHPSHAHHLAHSLQSSSNQHQHHHHLHNHHPSGVANPLGHPLRADMNASSSAVAATSASSLTAAGSTHGQPPPPPPPPPPPHPHLHQQTANSQFWQPGLQPSTSQDIKPFAQQPYPAGKPSTAVSGDIEAGLPPAQLPWEGRAIATHKFRLLEFSAFMEMRRDEIYHRHLFVQLGGKPSFSDPLLETVDIRQISDKFPEKSGGLKDLYEKGPQNAFYLVKCWADLNTELTGSETGDFYGVTSQYESNENVVLVCSTKVCSFGSQVVEKVETEYSRLENGRFVYRIERSPMCEYMINFIQKLKNLPERYMMNSVLENFTILQVIQSRETHETLLCIAYVFEVAAQNSGATHHIYRLIKE